MPSEGYRKVVANVDRPADHPRGADYSVVFRPGAGVASQCDRAVLGIRFHVAVFRTSARP